MGLYGSIWDNSRFPTYSKYCSNHAWLFHVCEFNNQHEIHLSIPHAKLSLRRINDRALMDVAADFLKANEWDQLDVAWTFRHYKMMTRNHGKMASSICILSYMEITEYRVMTSINT